MTNSGQKGSNFTWIGLALSFAGLVVLLIVYLVRRQREKNKLQPPTPAEITEYQTNKPNQAEQKQIFKQIYDAALTYGFGNDSALAIAGQSCHETGRWSSRLSMRDNNIFGMKNGGAGKGIQSGVDQGFATYESFEDSLLDYVEWCKAKNYPFAENLNIEQHLQWLKFNKYFEDTLANYKKSVLSLVDELNN